jgi:Dyp-type peroxidase family
LSDETRAGAANERALEVSNIQGNVIGGFNKDQQTMLFLRLEDENADTVAALRRWLAKVTPDIATAEEVLAFNALFKSMRARRGSEGTSVHATWVNIALSYPALALLRTDSSEFEDEAFKQGLAARAVRVLQDPADEAAEGNPRNWRFGGTDRSEAHVVLIVASDDPEELSRTIDRLRSGLPRVLKEIARIEGATLGGRLRGHEHFGFLDGVSQPGLRGRASLDERDVLTRRQNSENPAQGKPGQDLVWPGEFVFGYKQTNPDERKDVWDGDPAKPGPYLPVSPPWAADGSFLVVRRLRQDVDAFHQFLQAESERASRERGRTYLPDFIGAKLVGRWPSGAPISRAPMEDLPGRDDDCANNHFEFRAEDDEEHEDEGEGGEGKVTDNHCSDRVFPRAEPDANGLVCPWGAHIRKTYTRDDRGHGDAPFGEKHAQTRRLLRRGIPFTRSPSDRGLLFACYQTSIVEQFEFVQCSANDPNFRGVPTGHDLIIGQTNEAGARTRRCPVTLPGSDKPFEVEAKQDFVIPTGGGYFFAPSISALELLARECVREG